ncbi:uncharacterized protein LOC131891751 isoform X2 [Tigriopus californicus]|uniref:uncharacterized protein LOC131891751 isoform X2 n=1 Tax=Tigriopus californicus TaxID=6832 RepID=UPI0027D9D024|nr:uncharacterized protein LOC131891751 isoform X2 [Tigriopus californicus]
MELQPYSTDRKKALVDEIAQRIFEQIRIHGGRDLDAIVQGISNFQIPETVVELNQRAQEPPKVSHVNGHQNGPIKLEDKREWNLTPGAAVPTTPKPFRSTVESVQFQSEHPRRPSWVEMANKPLPTPNLQRSVSNVQISSGRPPIGALTNTLPRSNGAPRRPPPPSIHSALPSNGLRRSQSSQRLTLRPDDFWLKSRPSSRSTSMDNLHQSDHRISIGSAADGILHVGDRIVQIEHHNATKLAHFDAQNIIKHSGTNLKLGISRPGFSAPGAAPFSSLPAVKPSYTLPQKPHQGHAMHHQNQGFGSPPSQGGFYQPQPQIHQSNTYTNTPPAFTYGGPRLQSYSDIYQTSPAVHSNKTPAQVTAPMFNSNFSTFGPTPTNNNGSTAFHPQSYDQVQTPFNNKFQRPPTSPKRNFNKIPNSYMAPQGKTIDVGGVKKQVVTKQFNSPLNLYSDAAIVEAAVANPASGVSTGGHPGFVPTQRHLPSPKDKIISRPQQSETFKLILESEMDGARDQQGVVGREFHQPAHSSRPSSSLSNRSQPNAIMLDNTIHQSASFKRLMHNMAVGPESTEDQTDF